MTLDQGHDLTSDYRQPLAVPISLSSCKSYRPDDDVTTESP